MSSFKAGIPLSINVTVGPEGALVRFKQITDELVLRADSPCTLYWNKDDYDADRNGVVFPGDPPAEELRLRAGAFNVWLRGQGSEANVNITYTGRVAF